LSSTLQSAAVHPGVSFVIPVRNGEAWLERVLQAVFAQDYPGPIEVIVVDDASTDRSPAILRRHAATGRVRITRGAGSGASAALNAGIRSARFELIAQVDQDVVISPDWLGTLVAALAEPDVGAAQGEYGVAAGSDLWSRVMGLDLRERYARLKHRGTDVRPPIVGTFETDHVCTGNSVYRSRALHEIGLFDEALGYGYDNDVSYRLSSHGYRLVFCPTAISVHEWREGATGYVRQQYGFGYGRLEVIRKHRARVSGDQVSPVSMMCHAPLALLGWMLLGLAALTSAFYRDAIWVAALGAVVLGALTAERLVSGVTATFRFRDAVGLWFAPMHLVRDLAWSFAIVVWCAHRVSGRRPEPSRSMSTREPTRGIPL
jgi:cellulose synthase/poly-beta-1,6-N-acetylglucosamine synthase-like glycosyltransferase